MIICPNCNTKMVWNSTTTYEEDAYMLCNEMHYADDEELIEEIAVDIYSCPNCAYIEEIEIEE